MKRIFLLFMCACFVLPLMAEDKETRAMNPHELRLGWGDQHFEHLIWHSSPYPANTLPTTYTATYGEHYRYTQHWFIDYQYRLNHWFSFGGIADGSGVVWDKVTRNGAGDELSREKNHSLYNIVLMPSLNLTYLHHQYVSMYFGLGAGLDINGGTEVDGQGRHTVCAPAIDIRLIGISANYGNWFMAVDLGAMVAMNGGQYIYLLGSRLFTASIGVRF